MTLNRIAIGVSLLAAVVAVLWSFYGRMDQRTLEAPVPAMATAPQEEMSAPAIVEEQAAEEAVIAPVMTAPQAPVTSSSVTVMDQSPELASRAPASIRDKEVSVKSTQTMRRETQALSSRQPRVAENGNREHHMANGDGAGSVPERIAAGEDSVELLPATAAGPALAAIPTAASGQYKVELGADKVLTIPGPPGELLVWIGIPSEESHIPESMARATDTLPAVGATARISPFAPGFDVEPKQSVCMQIHPMGSKYRFQLIPKEKGTFKVGADVHLFDSDDCSGTPIPQAAATLEVQVVVDAVKVLGEHGKQLWEVFWEKLLEFWGAVVALFFGALLFLWRKSLKRLFGYKSE